MTCNILEGFVSEYVSGCDVSVFGEGCEKCVPLFESVWIFYVIIPIALAVVVLFGLGLLIYFAKDVKRKVVGVEKTK